jgi:hypothetical protein
MRFRLLLICLAVAALPKCHCHPSFHTNVTGQLIIPKNALPGVIDQVAPLITNIDFSQNQDFKNQGVSKNQVDSVVADSVTLRIDDPPTQDFRFLESLQIFAKTGNQQDKVAEKNSINQLNLPPPNPKLVLDTTGVELKPYVVADSMSIIVHGRGSFPDKDTTVTGVVTLHVVANLF